MKTIELAAAGPVVPVIILERVEDAVPLARALCDGGVRVLEVTLRTASALACIEAIAKAVPEAIVGAGTIRSADDARSASAAGARFAVSPGLTESVAHACASSALPLLPGVATPSEVMRARELGFSFVKLFPASVVGGVAMLKALASPFADVLFCPTGGITVETAPQYLALSNVAVVGGSWLTPADAIKKGDWARITQLARESSNLSRSFSSEIQR
ncbi:MAG: bifunctional 4-hydroxy-2-oxoglutarate aldolase/2-dehydro-3-deoxy-phosphogluconate aldolase [Polyangiales bacterium]